ncbi:MAG: DUF4263 domain-containing protein [Defluviitaleaceae bacterium]|nr:DUF4263 domain-containing protein [Defluviitaleaceae bacterium]
MVISDFIFNNSKKASNCFCRVRICVNGLGDVCAVLTDISNYISSNSVTNSVEDLHEALLYKGHIPEKAEIYEHYEDYMLGSSFDRVILSSTAQTKWVSCNKERFCEKYELDSNAFFAKTDADTRLMPQLIILAREQDPFRNFPYSPDPQVVNRRIEIEKNMLKKFELMRMIEKNATEKDLLCMLKTDLSVFAEVYANPDEEYICFSEFPIGNVGKVDFVLFSGRSRMDVTLIEIKGADFPLLTNRGGYKGVFASKIDIALNQVLDRYRYIYGSSDIFRKEVHRIRRDVENGKCRYNSLLGPRGYLQVDPEKDIVIRNVIIGGRTVDDLNESRKRHDFENRATPPMHLETWDSWLRKLSRI